MNEKDENITICTVQYSHNPDIDIPIIQRNLDLLRNINDNSNWQWIIVNNQPELESIKLNFGDVRCTVVDGSPRGGLEVNYHHAAAMNKAVSMVRTRFLLVLDPDFYIVRKNWLDAVINHMKKKGLRFLGVPWHPSKPQKYRYFPCVHCMFVDLNGVSSKGIDFTPETADRRRYYNIRKKLLRRLGMGRRSIVGNDGDTGCRIYKKYHRKSRHEVMTPVFRPGAIERGGVGKLISDIIPDSLSVIPKRPGYYSEIGFRELGYPDVSCFGWEEFLWQGEPFGFHLRRNKSFTTRNYENELNDLRRVLSYFVQESL